MKAALTPAMRRVLKVLKAGGSLLRVAATQRNRGARGDAYQLGDPAQPERTIWVRTPTVDALFDGGYVTRAYITDPITITAKGVKEG